MKNLKIKSKYIILLPILFIHFSCEDTSTSSTVYNGDVIGSWKLTALTGTYTYTVSIPAATSGVSWPADTSFGIRLKWEHEDNAAFGGGLAGLATFPLPTPSQPTGKHVAGNVYRSRPGSPRRLI